VTKKTNAALVAGKEEDLRTTVTSYGGQGTLGWKLRKPTSVTTDPGGLNLTTATVYQESAPKESTGTIVETRSAGGANSGTQVAPLFAGEFGSEGTGNGQLNHPESVATDAGGNVWVDDKNNGRLEKFTSTGQFIAAYGSTGSGSGQLSNAWGIAIAQATGNVYVAEMGNNRIQVFNSAGAFVRTFGFGVANGEENFQNCTASCRAGTAGTGNGQMRSPSGVAIDGAGNVWVSDYGNSRIEEFTASGEFIKLFGSKGSGNGQFNEPGELAFSEGNLYVTDQANHRVQEFSPVGTYLGQFGAEGSGPGQFKEPWGIAADPVTGDLYVVDSIATGRVEKFNVNRTFMAEVSGRTITSPTGIAVNAAGELYVTEQYAAKVSKWTPLPSAPVYASQFGTKGTGAGQFREPHSAAMATNGNVLVLDSANNRVEAFSQAGKYEATFGAFGEGSGQVSAPYAIAVDAKGNVWVTDWGNNRVEEFTEAGAFIRTLGWGVSNGAAAFQICTTGCKAGIAGTGAGQFKEPKGIAVSPAGNVYVSDAANNRLEEFKEGGEFVATLGYGVSTGEAVYQTCTSACKAGIAGSGNGQFKGPRGIAISAVGSLWVVESGNNRVQGFNGKNEYVLQFGSKGTGNGQFSEPKGIALSLTGNVIVADEGNDRIQEFTPLGTFLTTFGDKGTGAGQFEEPLGLAVAPTGSLYVTDVKNNRVEEWTPAPRPGNEGAHDKRVVYYTAKGEAEVAACQNHPEWVNLPCQTEPVAQSGVNGTPNLPVTTTTYSIWDAPEVMTETFGSTTRTKRQTFDSAGRKATSEVSSSVDAALPKVTAEYSSETGALIRQSTTVGEATKTITSVFNKLGQLESYIDGDGNTSRYAYDIDGRIEEVTDGKGSQIYVHDPTTGFLTEVLDSAAGAFTATYDVEGKMVTEAYPNRMTAKDTYDQAGAATAIEYVKTTHCATTCPETWFSDTLVPSIHGETLKQTSTLARDSYGYDNAGRLVETQETPTGKGCTTRVYGYDEESNRTALTTRESGTETCATEAGALESHSYDSANRLIDAGVAYELFGNITKLPVPDAGKYELTSTYYVDNQVASQTQNGETINFTYDPAGRPRETVSAGKTASTVVSHYSAAGGAPAWLSEGGEKWTRNIPGIDGALDVIQASGSSPLLQLHDIHGSIVATAALSETETKLLSSYNSTDFGVPSTSTPPKYSWLGAGGVFSEPSSGGSTITLGGASYVPQIARSLQTEGVALPGLYANGSYAGIPYTTTVSAGVIAQASAFGAGAPGREAERQTALAEEAKGNLQGIGVGGPGAEEEEEGEEEEEEGEEEGEETGDGSSARYAVYQHSTVTRTAARGRSHGHKKRHKKKKKGHHGGPNCKVGQPVHVPGDPSAGCCPDSPLSFEGYICDVPNPGPGQPYESPEGTLNCPEGTYPGVGAGTGNKACIPEGSEVP
jgi:YD repeat-containing protein